MRAAKHYMHKQTDEMISAIQYVGDKNKYYICEFLKGRAFQIEFDKDKSGYMKLCVGDTGFFQLYEKQWLTKNSEGYIGLISTKDLTKNYDLLKL